MWIPFKRAHFWTASSSAHLAYRLAAHFKAQRIALVGQDLCFHPDTFQSHCEVQDYPEWATPSSRDSRIQNQKAFVVAGNTRAEVLTDPTWSLFARDYEVLVNEVQIPTTNTSQLGMRLGNIAFQTLSEWLRPLETARTLQIHIPKQNPQRETDSIALQQKLSEARGALLSLKRQIQKLGPLESPTVLYNGISRTPHFLELVLEVVFSDWVKTENLCLNAGLQDAKDHQRKFLGQAAEAIDRVLSIIPSQLRL